MKFIKTLQEFLTETVSYHGSPHDFNYFSSSMFYEGEGNHGFGFGFYFTDERNKGEARLYKVKIPHVKYFLNLDIYNDEQNEYIKHCLQKIDITVKHKVQREYNHKEYNKYINDTDTDIEEYLNDSIINMHTKTFLDILTNIYDDSHAEILKKSGIKGNIHTSFGYTHYIVFDADDIKIITKTKPRV